MSIRISGWVALAVLVFWGGFVIAQDVSRTAKIPLIASTQTVIGQPVDNPSEAADELSSDVSKTSSTKVPLGMGVKDSRDQIVQVGDLLEVKLSDDLDLSLRLEVDKDGCVTVPYVGRVKVQGKRLGDAMDLVQKRINQFYVKKPDFDSSSVASTSDAQAQDNEKVTEGVKANPVNPTAVDSTKVAAAPVVPVTQPKVQPESKSVVSDVQAGNSLPPMPQAPLTSQKVESTTADVDTTPVHAAENTNASTAPQLELATMGKKTEEAPKMDVSSATNSVVAPPEESKPMVKQEAVSQEVAPAGQGGEKVAEVQQKPQVAGEQKQGVVAENPVAAVAANAGQSTPPAVASKDQEDPEVMKQLQDILDNLMKPDNSAAGGKQEQVKSEASSVTGEATPSGVPAKVQEQVKTGPKPSEEKVEVNPVVPSPAVVNVEKPAPVNPQLANEPVKNEKSEVVLPKEQAVEPSASGSVPKEVVKASPQKEDITALKAKEAELVGPDVVKEQPTDKVALSGGSDKVAHVDDADTVPGVKAKSEFTKFFRSEPLNSQVNEDRVLRPGDVLDVRMPDEPDLNTDVTVSRSGMIRLPYAGEVKVAGLTLQEAINATKKALSVFYVNPVLGMNIKQAAKREFVILGQVERPGVYEFTGIADSITLMEAIAKASGTERYGDIGRVTVKRDINGEEQAFSFDAGSMAQGEVGNTFQVMPGDTIIVRLANHNFTILGEIRNPGVYTLPPLQDSVDLMDAIAMAGGAAKFADLGEITVKRMVNGEERILKIKGKELGRNESKQRFQVYPGDDIMVKLLDNQFVILGQIQRPGSYQIPPLQDNVDVLEALAMAGGATRLANLNSITVRRMVNGKDTVMNVNLNELVKNENGNRFVILPGDRIVVSERMF